MRNSMLFGVLGVAGLLGAVVVFAIREAETGEAPVPETEAQAPRAADPPIPPAPNPPVATTESGAGGEGQAKAEPASDLRFSAPIDSLPPLDPSLVLPDGTAIYENVPIDRIDARGNRVRYFGRIVAKPVEEPAPEDAGAASRPKGN